MKLVDLLNPERILLDVVAESCEGMITCLVDALISQDVLASSNLIDSFIEFFHNVKAVQNVECFGKHFGNDFEVWLPHIRTNHLNLNLTTIIWPKVEKGKRGQSRMARD